MKKYTWFLLVALCLGLCAPAWAEEPFDPDSDALVAAWMQNRQANGIPAGVDDPSLTPGEADFSQEDILRIVAKALQALWPGELEGLKRYTPTTMLTELPDGTRRWHVPFFTDAPLMTHEAYPADLIYFWLDAESGLIREYGAEKELELFPMTGDEAHG
jgi:hypothetical protein